MNRHEAIEKAANEIAMALTRKGYVNIKNGKDEPRIDALYKALAMPDDAPDAMAESITEPKEYPESVAGQVSVFRMDTNTISIEFAYSEEFKSEYLNCLEIGDIVRVPLYTHPPKDAEREELVKRIDALDWPNYSPLEAAELLPDIRAFLGGE